MMYTLDINIGEEIRNLGVGEKMNDYIGVQKIIPPILEQQDFFGEIVNDESGMVIEITRKGIKETLGNGKNSQLLSPSQTRS